MPIITPWKDHKPRSKEELHSLVQLVALAIERLIKRASHLKNAADTVFYAQKTITTSIEQYIQRFVNLAELGEPELICMLILLDKYTEKTKETLNQGNIHRLIAAALVITQKKYSNACYDMDYYAILAELSSLQEIYAIEKELLSNIDSLSISLEQYCLYKENLALCVRKLGYDRPLTQGADEVVPQENPLIQAPESIPSVNKAPAFTHQQAPIPGRAYNPHFWVAVSDALPLPVDLRHMCTIV